MKIDGQWIGSVVGDHSATVLVDLDQLEVGYEGTAYLWEQEDGMPNVAVRIVIPETNISAFEGEFRTICLHPKLPIELSLEDVERDFPEVKFPTKANINIEIKDGIMLAAWRTDIGTSGSAKLHKSQADLPSEISVNTDIKNWKEFKEYVLTLDHRKYIFRGQDKPYKLRTSFHRTRRKDLFKYLEVDLPNAHHTLTSRTNHIFNLADSSQNAAFLNLLQHHGYPTPLLDWSYSPFVAAFFAFRFRRNRLETDDKVRIIIFNKSDWEESFRQTHAIAYARPHFSLIEPLSIENLRAIPQQSICSVTNLDDIEAYISACEGIRKKSFIEAIDLPFSERRVVMQELSLMGITAGSLFPGLDGACEELRGRFYHPFD